MATRKKKTIAPSKTGGTDLVTVDAQMQKELANIASQIGAVGGNKIQISGKTFKMPDGVVHPGPIECVIVDFNSRNTFYDGPYDANNITPPACFAIGPNPNALVPSDNSPDKQAASCSECVNNVFGSEGKGKACRNSRLVAIVQRDAEPGDPIMVIGVSPTALKGFDSYIATLSGRYGVLPCGAVTSISFDTTSQFPKLVFSFIEENPLVREHYARKAEAQVILSAEPDVSQAAATSAQAARAPKKGKTRKHAATR